MSSYPTMHELSRALARLDMDARQERICFRAREERQILTLRFPAKGYATHIGLAPRR